MWRSALRFGAVALVAAACSGLTLASEAGSLVGTPGKSGRWTFTVSVSNCTGRRLHALKVRGETAAWLSGATVSTGHVSFKGLLKHIEGRLHLSPIFRQKLLRVPLELDFPYWIEDECFDLEYHVRHIALPKPGDWRQFCIQASRIHARPPPAMPRLPSFRPSCRSAFDACSAGTIPNAIPVSTATPMAYTIARTLSDQWMKYGMSSGGIDMSISVRAPFAHSIPSGTLSRPMTTLSVSS